MLSELGEMLEKIEYCAFLIEADTGNGFKIAVKLGNVLDKISPSHLGMLKQCLQEKQSVFAENCAELNMSQGHNRSDAILIQYADNW